MEKHLDKLAAMIQIMSAQIDAALRDSDAPAKTLAEAAHALGQATQTIARGLCDFSTDPSRVVQELMLLHDDLHARSTNAATAIQFHDRLAQCLMHVSASLMLLAEFVSDGDVTSAAEWVELRDRIRSLLSMEKERALFDRLSGMPEPAGAQDARSEAESRKVELF